jgi:hypothetical protein
MTRILKLALLSAILLFSLQALAQDPAAPAAAAPAAPAAPPPAKRTGGPSLSLSPETPQVGGLVVSPAEAAPVVEEAPTSEWKFEVTGYFRAPLRMSWGPPTGPDTLANTAAGHTVDPGTQLRTPPLVPDANYVDWRYTNSLVGPWTELNFHYGNDRVKATVQIASYNLTDPGYRRLEANLGINQAFISMQYPEIFNVEDLHLTLIVGGFTNRYGAAGRYDGGKYETYLFGRTHVAGETANLTWDHNDWSFQAEEGFGGKLEPIPFYGPPGSGTNPNTQLPPWEPYPGPVPQEPTFVAHVHAGAAYKKQVLFGAHYINVFANGNELATAYTTMPFNSMLAGTAPQGRPSTASKPSLVIWGADVKWLTGLFGDGYLGFSHVTATNALYLADAIELLHSFGGWQLHDNFFGPPGQTDPVTGSINSVEFQEVFSFGQFLRYPQAFWGDGPDLLLSVFGMFNQVNAPMNRVYDGMKKLKAGVELTYIPLPWLGTGFRYDNVRPDLDHGDTTIPVLAPFSVFSPRIILRTAFVTHEQIMFQYSRYFYANTVATSVFPYNQQLGGANISSSDKNAFTMAAIIWF